LIFTRTRFADPVAPEDLVPGDLFTVDSDEASWLGVRLPDDDRGWPMAMLLAGPDLHGERVPLPVDLKGIDEGLGRLAVERLSIEPWAGEPLAEAGIEQHGSLVIDGAGEAWLAYRRRSRPGSEYLSLLTFRRGLPAVPTLTYPTWRIVLKEEGREHELVAFAPGGTVASEARWRSPVRRG
jgi:hypothetical protein